MHINEPSTDVDSIAVNGREVEVKVYCESDKSGTAYCAAYGSDGRMLGIWAKALTPGTENTINCTVNENADTVKAFALDDLFVPLCLAKEQRIPV